MKFIVAALACLLAGSNADQAEQTPDLKGLLDSAPEQLPPIILDENELNSEDHNDGNALSEDELEGAEVANNHYIVSSIISSMIRSRINWLLQSVPEPFKAPNLSISFTKNDRGSSAFLKDVVIDGLKDLNIDHINVNNWGTAATTILRLPKVELECGKIGLDHTIFDSKLTAVVGGTISLSNTVIVVETVINPIRLTVTSVKIGITFIGPVQSKLKLELLGADVSKPFNRFVEEALPTVLQKNKAKLEDLLKAVAFPHNRYDNNEHEY